MTTKTLTAAIVAAAGLLVGGLAQARPDVQWSVTVGNAGAPLVIQPAPVYRPAPRVVVLPAPAPVYVPAPVLRRHGPPPWAVAQARYERHARYDRIARQERHLVATRWDRDGDGWANRDDRFPDNPRLR